MPVTVVGSPICSPCKSIPRRGCFEGRLADGNTFENKSCKFSPRSPINISKMHMTSHPCNKSKWITLSCLLSVKQNIGTHRTSVQHIAQAIYFVYRLM